MIRKLINRLVNRETVTYLIFGVLTTLVNYIVYYGLELLGVDYKIAEVAAWIISVIFAFFTNKKYVFLSTDYDRHTLLDEFWKFTAGRILTFLFEFAFLLITVERFHLDDRIMKLAASVVVVILNYVFSKLFIFNKEKSHDQTKKDI